MDRWDAITIVKDKSESVEVIYIHDRDDVTRNLMRKLQACGSRFGNRGLLCTQDERIACNADTLNSTIF